MNELKSKPFVVTDPSGKEQIAYAKTQAGAIGDVQAAQRVEWKARPATGEEMYTGITRAAERVTVII